MIILPQPSAICFASELIAYLVRYTVDRTLCIKATIVAAVSAQDSKISRE